LVTLTCVAGLSAQGPDRLTQQKWNELDTAQAQARSHATEAPPPAKQAAVEHDWTGTFPVWPFAALIVLAIGWELFRQHRHENQWRRKHASTRS